MPKTDDQRADMLLRAVLKKFKWVPTEFKCGDRFYFGLCNTRRGRVVIGDTSRFEAVNRFMIALGYRVDPIK